ncbi:hypothetical protein ABMA27_012966 [Loxostege sticticalis]|uniref:Uncharacterized protein n=1 Tax=Loxostege sticticalis TaxID=481309 RepID=A0ABR3IDK3_LOXSC
MLVALAASLFALITTTHAQELCGTNSIGVPVNTQDMVKQLPPVSMPAGSREVMVDIPEHACAPAGMIGSVPGGVSLKACDYAAAPVVHLKSLKHAVVSRASYSASGVVHTTVQCVPI